MTRGVEESCERTAGALRLQILGPLRVWRGDAELDAGPRQQRRVLALLMAREGRSISTAGLVEQLWGPDAPASAVNAIHRYIGALRRLLEPDLRPRSAGSYLLRFGAAGPRGRSSSG
jgi:DNA-binding SARP family transcriptional activator